MRSIIALGNDVGIPRQTCAISIAYAISLSAEPAAQASAMDGGREEKQDEQHHFHLPHGKLERISRFT